MRDLAGGGLSRAYSLALALQAVGHRVEIIGRSHREAGVYPEPPAELTVSHSSDRGDRADVLIAQMPALPSYGAALLERRRRGVPIVLDVDDWEPRHFGNAGHLDPRPADRFGSIARRSTGLARSTRRLGDPNHSLYSHWLRRRLRQADALTVSTREVQRRLGGTYVAQARDTVHFDPARFDPETCRRRLGLSGVFVLMFPGTPRAHNGLEDLLVALERIGRDDLRLVLVGGRRSEYATALYKRWSRWIVRLPRVPSDGMAEIVAAAHVVVAPQRDEPAARAQFPMKVTDGMAMAKPILTTRVGDLPDIVGDGGYLVEPSQPDELAAAIESIRAHPEEAMRRGLLARQCCIERFSLPAVGAVLADVLEGVMAMRTAEI